MDCIDSLLPIFFISSQNFETSNERQTLTLPTKISVKPSPEPVSFLNSHFSKKKKKPLTFRSGHITKRIMFLCLMRFRFLRRFWSRFHFHFSSFIFHFSTLPKLWRVKKAWNVSVFITFWWREKTSGTTTKHTTTMMAMGLFLCE